MSAAESPIGHHPAIISALESDAVERAIAAFSADGVVVISNALTPEEIESCLHELWTSPRLLNRSGTVDRSKPETWTSESGWPQQDGGRNFLASLEPYADTANWQLAQHVQVVKFVQALYRAQSTASPEDATVIMDGIGRWGVMRPSASKPEWRTDENWLHWDQSPYTEPDFVRLQVFVALTEQSHEAGGLLAVPGFHHAFKSWAAEHPEGSVVVDGKVIDGAYGRNRPFPIPLDDPVQAKTVKICAPAGSLVFWDSRIPHQNFPNKHGSAFRVVHYLNFVQYRPNASAADKELLEQRRETVRRIQTVQRVRAGELGAATCWPAVLTDVGREIIGLGPHGDPNDADAPPVKLCQAIQLAVEAGQKEAEGDFDGSVELLRRANKIFPEFETWYDAVFGT